MSVTESKAIVLSFLKVVWEGRNLSLVDELVADDHVHHMTVRNVLGPEGVKQLVGWGRGFVPDARVTIKDLIGEGDKVVAHSAISGTDMGGYREYPPSGNPVACGGIDTFRLAGGWIVERWGIAYTIHMMCQIGAIPG